MHSANFTAFSTLAAVLPPPLLPEPVAAGAFEPHALIRATMAIRARAASGRSFLLMASPRSPRAPMIAAMTTAIARRIVDRVRLLAVLVRCRSRLQSRQRDVVSTYVFFDMPTTCSGLVGHDWAAHWPSAGRLVMPIACGLCPFCPSTRPISVTLTLSVCHPDRKISSRRPRRLSRSSFRLIREGRAGVLVLITSPATSSEQLRVATIAASVSPSATSRAKRSYRALPDRRGDGVDQLLGGLARGGEEHRRVAALPRAGGRPGRPAPPPPPPPRPGPGHPAPADRHLGEEGQAPLGRGVRRG